MVLKSEIHVLMDKYKGGSKDNFFKGLEIGDPLQLEFVVNDPGRNGDSLYASYMSLKNLRNNQEYITSITLMNKALDKIPMEPLGKYNLNE